jgi:hypothetical protein
MNKSELIEKIAENKELSELKKSQIELMLNETLTIIKKSVKKEDITLIGFGTFSKSKLDVLPALKGFAACAAGDSLKRLSSLLAIHVRIGEYS